MGAALHSWVRGGSGQRAEAGRAATGVHPQHQLIEVKIDDECREDSQTLADEQPTDNHKPERGGTTAYCPPCSA